jgi:thioredoxin-dependent peroxiredoxin
LEGNDGKKHSLEDYRGKTVVLYFYPKDDAPGCTKEACGFRDLTPSLKNSGTRGFRREPGQQCFPQ